MPQWVPILTSSGTAKVLAIVLRRRRAFNGSREQKGEKWREKKKALGMRVMAQGKSNEQRWESFSPVSGPSVSRHHVRYFAASLPNFFNPSNATPSVWTRSWELRGMYRKHSHHIPSLQHIMNLRMPALFAFPLSQREQSQFHATTTPSTSFAS